ncbi:MAG: hypothetical protein OER98_17300, partial [Gammaproteobacteria bacterium]|nr:hypothetical protein [Gammaproteobacteria bacterium]
MSPRVYEIQQRHRSQLSIHSGYKNFKPCAFFIHFATQLQMIMRVRFWPFLEAHDALASVSFAEFRPSNFDIEIRLVMAKLLLGIFHRTPECCFIFFKSFC